MSLAAQTSGSPSREGRGPGLLLLGHTDVVPVGDGWTRDPFGGDLIDGRIYGRGASDMKGGLAASLAALAALRGVGCSGPVELAALVDEEENGTGIRGLRRVANAGRCWAASPPSPPTSRLIIAARGASYFRIEVHGRAAHAGKPDDGANAIYGAAAIVAEIERLHAELATAAPSRCSGPRRWSVGQIQRRQWRIHRARGMRASSPTADCCPASRPHAVLAGPARTRGGVCGSTTVD